MFTGIIEELGSVKSMDLQKNSARLTINAQKILTDAGLGDSIAVNGVCLTITDLSSGSFSVDIMYETLNRTNLKELKKSSKVNLERALQLKTRLGGHFVSGHIDGTGKIIGIDNVGIASIYKILTTPEITSFIISKGSIAVDGISLTVVDVWRDSFTVSLIPHTFRNTTLGLKNIGSTVNLETDLLGKYVAKFIKNDKETEGKDISVDFLTEHGFID
jgi:riboflavin synthase